MLNKVVIALGLLVGSFLTAWAASSTLSGLAAGTSISSTDLFYDVQTVGVGGVKVTGAQFLSFVYGNVSGSCTASNVGVFSCSSGASIGVQAGSNISTSGTAANVTINVISTPTFSSITTTLASVTGWLTAAGVNMQTATVAGNLTATTAQFTGFVTASGVNFQSGTVAGVLTSQIAAVPGFLTASGANLNTATIVGLGVSTQCVQSVAGALTGTGSTCGTGQFSINAGTNITTSGTANNVTINVVATPTFTNLTSTIAAVPGFLTASGASLQTLTLAGSIVVGVRSSASAAVTASASSDYFLCLDSSTATITVALPASPATGLTYLVKDCTGQAATHGIILSPSTGNIDSASNSIMTRTFGSEAVTYTGTQWSIN